MPAGSSVVLSDEPPRKKMRKGTRSCAECRRRKKSCIPHPSSPNVCAECSARGVQCQEQQASSTIKTPGSDSKRNLQQRVAELETALQSIATKLGSTGGTSDNSSANETEKDAAKTLTELRAELAPPTPAGSSSVSSPGCRLGNAPVLSLFDNSILSRFQDDDSGDTPGTVTSPASETAGSHPSKIDNIRQTMLSLFPSQIALDAILDASQFFWQASQAMLPYLFGPEPGQDAHQFVAGMRASGNVQKIAKALLFISVGLQEASPGLNLHLGPSVTAADLSMRYLNVIYDLVISDEELVGTIDGIECLFLYYKHNINDGRIRRAWINIRRALSFSQLIGLHTLWKSTPRPHSDPAFLRGESLWKALYQSDRFLSLLLGLPYAVSEIPGTVSAYTGVNNPSPAGEHYLFRLSSIVGHIIDRNQEPPNNNTLPLTMKIESELADLTASMPSNWWVNDTNVDNVADQMYTRLLPQFWHHQARTLLHLPFMLKASTDRRYEYNRIAALESAREMLKRYEKFRPGMGLGSNICKVVDFQIFTAAMVLVLNLLSTSASSPPRDREEAAADEELITKTHDLLHRASLETEAGVTTQAARALKMFCKARADPCRPGQKSAKVVIPYFGAVAFGPGQSLTNQEYLEPLNAGNQPVQLPTPETEQSNNLIHGSSNFDNLWATMLPDLNFGGYQPQQPEIVGTGGEIFANVNLNLDQDWSWFWNNTNLT